MSKGGVSAEGGGPEQSGPGSRQGLSLWQSVRAFALLLFMGTTWGGTISLAKIASHHGGHPLGIALCQTAGAGMLLLLLSLLRGQGLPLHLKALGFYLVCGIIGGVLPALGLFIAAAHIPAGVVSIGLATMPLFTYGLSVLLRVEAVNRRRLFGVILGLSAVVLLVLPDSSLPGGSFLPWVLLALGAAFGYAVENLFIALRRPADLDSFMVGAGRQLVGALLLLPLALTWDKAVPLFTAWGPLQWAVTGMAVGSALAFATFIYVLTTAGPVFASQVAYLITLAGVLWGMALFGERHSPWIWAAMLLIFLGLSLVRPRRQL